MIGALVSPWPQPSQAWMGMHIDAEIWRGRSGEGRGDAAEEEVTALDRVVFFGWNTDKVGSSMATKKFAISVPEDVMDEVSRAAAQQGVSRSAYIVQVLRRLAGAQKDAEISRRINALFDDPAIAAEQAQTARAFRRSSGSPGTEW